MSVLVLMALVLGACVAPAAAPAAAPAGGEAAATQEAAPAAEAGGIQIPTIEEGKFNVAFVYVGPIGDGGYTYAHNQGREYVDAQLGDKVHTAYIESVPEGADAERVIRNLARAGFDAVITTSFGYMDPTATVAEEFPDTDFIHVSGFKSNDTNFANLFGAMEDMKYLSGMVAGARAKADGSNKVGYIAPFPIPEVIRLANATTMGMRQTCPECTMDLRWTFSWFDPKGEQQAAESLLDGGASVVVTGADTPFPVKVAGERGLWGIGYDSSNSCEVDLAHCLTTPYWNWGPEYAALIQQMMDGTFQGGSIYFDADSGGLGLVGFMEGETPLEGVPADVIPLVQETLAKMESGEMTRFDIFSGPIKDNKGAEIVPAGEQLTQLDLEGLEGCTYCMNWLVEGVVPDAEIPQ
ncbi:MAG: BMP family ABC transporter substrate-binding protein [Anaerolineales bacterium]|nr:BMP family ABC transporter substrate-binding protein [Anaerolineales bacterium]